MKYLKTYENTIEKGKYWLIPPDERLYQSLVDIGCPDSKIKAFLKNPGIKRTKFCFISFINSEKIFNISVNIKNLFNRFTWYSLRHRIYRKYYAACCFRRLN